MICGARPSPAWPSLASRRSCSATSSIIEVVTKSGVTLSVYSQYDYSKEKRAALELWADRLEGIVAGAAKIVPIRA